MEANDPTLKAIPSETSSEKNAASGDGGGSDAAAKGDGASADATAAAATATAATTRFCGPLFFFSIDLVTLHLRMYSLFFLFH